MVNFIPKHQHVSIVAVSMLTCILLSLVEAKIHLHFLTFRPYDYLIKRENYQQLN